MRQTSDYKVKISIIAAVAENNVIGNDNALLWHISEDLKRFKQLTENHSVIMGRKTYLSLPFRPLKNRRNIVISRNTSAIEGVEVVSSVEKALNLCENDDEVFIIGGASVYEQTIEIADKLYITRILKHYFGDAYFPMIDEKNWKKTFHSEKIYDEKENLYFYYELYER